MKDIAKSYWAIFTHDDENDTVMVRFPQHQNILTYGQDEEHALEMAEEALAATLESEFDREEPLPATRKPKAKTGEKLVLVRVEPQVWMAYMLREWRKDAGLSQKQLASKLGVSYQAYQRMERPGRSNLTVDTLERIATCLGFELTIGLKKSA